MGVYDRAIIEYSNEKEILNNSKSRRAVLCHPVLSLAERYSAEVIGNSREDGI